VKEKIFIKQTQRHSYFRTMFWVDRNATAAIQSEIIIINEENEYSEKFKELLKDYYLNL
jgi:tRNA1(Val) A37 N6-methylase TrmN6